MSQYVVLFDESLNKHLQSKQMDIHVRLWDGPEVKTKYIGSEFLGHSTAIDVVEKISKMLSETELRNLLQLSRDGPHVNWKVFELTQKEMNKQVDKVLVNVKFMRFTRCAEHIQRWSESYRLGNRANPLEPVPALS